MIKSILFVSSALGMALYFQTIEFLNYMANANSYLEFGGFGS